MSAAPADQFSMRPRGPFSLAASTGFVEGFPGGAGSSRSNGLDLVFPVEGVWQTVGVHVRQPAKSVEAVVVGNATNVPANLIQDQVAHILSMDVDGTGFPAVGQRDPVVRVLQQMFPGLRPVQFNSAYEAAAWTIIGQRIRMTQAAAIKNRLAAELGDAVGFGDQVRHGFPPPSRLVSLGPTRGLTDRKVEQLRALGRAAADGYLDTKALLHRNRDEALRYLQQLPGIGPFAAELILLRGAGDPDAFPLQEKRLHGAMASWYDLGGTSDVATLTEIADRWRPYRTWVAVLLRSWLEQQTAEVASDAVVSLAAPGVHRG